MEHLSDEEWDRIDTLLEEVWDLAAGERAAFLDAACADEPELREQVEALLRAEAEAPDFLDGEAASFAGPAFSERGGEEPPRRHIGAYRLVEKIGRGGMSRIYRARRADGAFEQEVAVKLLRMGVDTPEARQRFRIERQVLASLDHPRIARLIDGGLTDDGMPYLVMEHVEGQSITDYCDEHRLPIRARLQLLATVGKALQYAHRNLVIHRDLKPSNILVTSEGGVKLLDFGIAKLLDAEADSLTVPATRTGVRPMTPAYAAPEQIRGEAVTAATDVYQLGVLAYELLTGRRPYAPDERNPFEVERAVLEEAPTRPSTVVTEGAQAASSESVEVTPEAVSRKRSTSTDGLQHVLHGDLDAIVMKALQKSPDRRYASAEAFAADVKRHLAGWPVQARPITPRYRLRKFVRRNKTGVAAAVAGVILIIGFIAALMWQQAQTAQQRNRAQTEAQKAEQVSSFMVDLFEASDPEASQGETVTAQQLLQRGEERADQLGDRPAVQAELLNAMGRAYQGLGHYDTARTLLKQSLQLRRKMHGSNHPDAAQSLHNLANVFAEERDFEPAVPLYREALAIRRRVLGRSHVETAKTLRGLAASLRNMHKPDSAVALARRALAIHRRHQDSTHPEVIDAKHTLAYALRAAGRYEEGAVLYRQVLDNMRTHYGPDHSKLAEAHNDFAYLLKEQGDYAAAARHYRQALDIRRSVFGPAHPRTTLVMQNLAGTLWEQEEYGAVEDVLRERVRVLREHAPEDRRRLGKTLGGLSRFFVERGRWAEAVEPMRDVHRIYREHLGERNLYTICRVGELGAILKVLGQNREADSLLGQNYAYLRAKRDTILQHRDTYTRLDTEYSIRAMIKSFEQGNLSELARQYRALLRSYDPEAEV